MRTVLIVAILAISTSPLYAQGQAPNAAQLKADTHKVAGIIKLNGPLPKVPADAYINPVVKDLFLQVNVCIEPSRYI